MSPSQGSKTFFHFSSRLFDELEITLHFSENQGLPFVKEYQVVEKECRFLKTEACFDAAGFLHAFLHNQR